MPEQYLLFFLLALIAEILGTVSGFGSSILFVPMASLFFEFKTVLGITAVFHVCSNLSKLALFRKGVDRMLIRKLGIPAVVAVIIGASITAYVPSGPLELMLNAVLLVLAIYLALNFNKALAPKTTTLALGGTASGFLAGLVGTGVAIRGLVLAAFHLSKESYVATSAFIDLGVDLSRTAVYLSHGYKGKAQWILIPFLLVIAFVGSLLDKLILKRFSEKTFRIVVLSVIVFTALWQLISYGIDRFTA